MAKLTFEQKLAKTINENPGVKIIFSVDSYCFGIDDTELSCRQKMSVSVQEFLDKDSAKELGVRDEYKKEQEEHLFEDILRKIKKKEGESEKDFETRAYNDATAKMKNIKWKKFIELMILPR